MFRDNRDSWPLTCRQQNAHQQSYGRQGNTHGIHVMTVTYAVEWFKIGTETIPYTLFLILLLQD